MTIGLAFHLHTFGAQMRLILFGNLENHSVETMKRPDLSRGGYYDSPMLAGVVTAHSGPELVRSVPSPRLARELAQALLTDHVQINISTAPAAGSSFPAPVTIGLARR